MFSSLIPADQDIKWCDLADNFKSEIVNGSNFTTVKKGYPDFLDISRSTFYLFLLLYC